jgi:hypothetical protein
MMVPQGLRARTSNLVITATGSNAMSMGFSKPNRKPNDDRTEAASHTRVTGGMARKASCGVAIVRDGRGEHRCTL